MANTSYTAAPSLVATNTTQQLSIVTDTKLNVTAPWLASGNSGDPDISTTLAATATAGSSSLLISAPDNFPDTYPSVFQSGIYYLPPSIGRLAGAVTSGTNVIPFVGDNDLPSQMPIFVRLGSEILQVTSYGTATVGSTNYRCLNTATNTASAHPDFTPIHLNSLPTDVQYTSITVPHFYLADASTTGTMSGVSNTISTASPSTLGNGQTITTATGGTTYLPANTTVTAYSSGLITLSSTFSTTASGISFVNSATFAMVASPKSLTSITNVTSAAGGTHTSFASLPSIGSTLTGTGLASPTYLSALDSTNLKITISANPTSYASATFTSTLTFTCSTTSGSRFLTIKNITVNGTSYAKVGSTNPTWNGRTLGYYLKVGAPITTASGGGVAGKYIASIQVSKGTVYLSAAATATVATATITSAITMTGNTGRAVVLTNNASSEINKLIATGTSIADNTGATSYVPANTTISKTVALTGGTTTELWMSAASGTTGAWTGQTAKLSTTFTGSSGFSNQITGVANASTLYQVGALVYGNQYIPDNTTITAVSGTTITLSNQLTNGFSTYTGQSFKVGSSLIIGKNYSTLPVTPLPCTIPAGATLYLQFGNCIQALTVASSASAGDTTISVSSFQSRYNFSTTSYQYGVAQTSTGGYGYGATITIGLNSDLFPGQAIMLQANNSTDYTNTLIVDAYTKTSSRTITTKPFISTYAYDGQSVGFATTGTFTGGSNQITSVGSTASLSVGQQVFSTALPTTAQYFITAISGSTVTLSGNATSSGSGVSFSVYSTTFTASYPMTVDTGNLQEVVYPISLPTSSNGAWSVNLAYPTTYQHNGGVDFVYYHWPVPLQTGNVTYRPDFQKFFMWDGFQWRTARCNSVRGVYSILGAVGGGDITNITLFDPYTHNESAADTFRGVPSTDYSTYHGGARVSDPNGDEWTGETLSRIQLHLSVKVPQSKSVGFRSLALESTYKAEPLVSSIHFTPGDNLEIARDITNTVFWYYSDLENEPQTGWEVKIFDDYTYNRPDFSPDNASITPFWKSSGADDSAEVEITGANGWVNGERYWAFVRVAKQFHQKQWWGDWNYQRFVVTVDQPSPPIMSIYTDNTNSVNTLAIQSTDNLLGDDNGTFATSTGQWGITSNDTASSVMRVLADGVPLGATLATSGAISSLTVGATGYVITLGALSGTGIGTFRVSSSASGGQDALGFPSQGRFWVTIDSEKLLVTNKMDGNKNGDTFTIVQRGYLGTTAASHSLGAAVLFGLQNDIYVGSVAALSFHKHTVVKKTTTATHKVRNYNGRDAYNEPKSRQALTILTQTQGKDKNKTDQVLVADPQGLLSSKDVGSTVVLSFHSWRSADQKNVVTTDANGTKTVTTQAYPDKPVSANQPREVQMTIKSIQDIWDDTAHKAGKINLATVATQVAGSTSAGDFHNSVRQLTVNSLLRATQMFTVDTKNACVSHNYLPTGTVVKVEASSIHDPVANKDLPAASMSLILTQPWHPTDKTIHFRPIVKAPGFSVGNGSCFIIPAGATITYAPPVVFTGRKVIHFTSKYTDKKGYSAQKLQPGDGCYIIKGRYYPAIKNTATGFHNETVTTTTRNVIDIDSTQDFVVDFISQPTTSTGGVLGTLTGSSFVIATGATYAFNAIAFSANPGSVAGAYISTPGLAPNSTVKAVTTVVGGTYAGYYAVTVNDSTGTQTTITAQNGTVAANAVSSPLYTGINATFVPSSSLIIPAGSQSIPIRPAIPKFPYQQWLPITIRYPSFYGQNVLAVDPTTGTGSSGDISEISLYPTSWVFTDQNPVAVNAGQTYGFAAFCKLISGSGTPTFIPRIDWYDDFGSFLNSSYGNESLNTPGTYTSATISTQINAANGTWGNGWNPVAMVATAPKVTLGTATFTSLSSSTGNFVIGAQAGFLTRNLKAGSVIYDANLTEYTLSSDVTATSAGFTLPVRFNSGIAVPATATLTISATRAVLSLRWTSVKAADVYGVSGVMFNALNAPSLGGNSTTSTELPKLSSAITVANNKVTNAFPIPSTTPMAGVNSLFVFDPVGDYNTRELHFGGGLNTLWTNNTVAVAVGATQVTLGSVDGVAPGVSLIFQYGSGNQETVVVDSSWAGGTVVPVAAPYFTKAHPKGSRVYSYTAGLASEVNTTQAVNTPVAVFNYGPDGYIAADRSAYQYKVEKSEDGGITWQTLRHGSALRADDTGVAYLTDYEAVPGLTTYYRATATHYVPPSGPANDYTVTGKPSQPLLANTIVNNNWWLASTSDDSLRYPMLVKTGYGETQRHPSGVFYPLGSSRPVTLAGVPTGRDGNITVTWTDNANFNNFLALLNKGETLVLTNPVESDRKYIFINQDVSITHNAANSPYREITINYVEAAPPNFGYTYGS